MVQGTVGGTERGRAGMLKGKYGSAEEDKSVCHHSIICDENEAIVAEEMNNNKNPTLAAYLRLSLPRKALWLSCHTRSLASFASHSYVFFTSMNRTRRPTDDAPFPSPTRPPSSPPGSRSNTGCRNIMSGVAMPHVN